MPKRFGTTKGLVDWNTVVDICKHKDNGDRNTVTSVVDRSEISTTEKLADAYQEVIKTWDNAGYKLSDIEWYDYYPGIHFDTDVCTKFADLVNADPKRVFVSELFPGRNVPYHWDVDDKEEQWLSEGSLKRWVCFIDTPKDGHVFILENECFYKIEQHEIYEWDNYRSFHAGTNCGYEPYYLFHFLGRPR